MKIINHNVMHLTILGTRIRLTVEEYQFRTKTEVSPCLVDHLSAPAANLDAFECSDCRIISAFQRYSECLTPWGESSPVDQQL